MTRLLDRCGGGRLGLLLASAAMLLAVVCVYAPGLGGAFLFDDHSSLRLLAEAGRVRTFDDWVRYLASGFAGPSGRPVALASFLLDGHHWPVDATIPKGTNLLLHLLNTLLLAALVARLLTDRLPDARQRLAAASLAAGLWALHPLWVSTTLYVVQRMTLLATGFSFAALLLYMAGRDRFAAGRTTQGGLWMAVGLFGCGTLAVLSKENAAALPLLVLVLERYALAPMPEALRGPHRRWLIALAGIPAVVLLGYLASHLPALWGGQTPGRPYTPYERLLTQGRVLVDYLWRIWLPSAREGGLYHDDFPLSTGLFSPGTTLAAWLAIGAGVFLAERWRKRFALLATAYLFFLAGHLIESGWIPLEPYFEHRNYLPASLMFVPLATGIVRHAPRLRYAPGIAVALLGLFAMLTLVRSDLWGRPFLLALSWAEQHPQSVRAQTQLAQRWLESGNTLEAARLLDRMLALKPEELLLHIHRLAVDCTEQRLDPQRVAQLLRAVADTDFRHPVRRYQLITLVERLETGACPAAAALDLETRLLAQALQQPAEGRWRAELLYQRARHHLAAGRFEQARADFRAALREHPSRDLILLTAAALAERQHFEEALWVLDRITPLAPPGGWSLEALRERWLEWRGYWQQEFDHLRRLILQDRQQALFLPQERFSTKLPV